jgi:hypothetical protein
MVIDYKKLECRLVNSYNGYFMDAGNSRLDAARKLQSAGSLIAFLAVAEYRSFKSNFNITETSPEVEAVTGEIWNTYSERYLNLEPKWFLWIAACHYIGCIPRDDDILPKESYEKIYMAFHVTFVPEKLCGRVDGRLYDWSGGENSLQAIIKGYENFKELEKKEK